MAMIPETLANLNLFVDGVSFQGDVPSLTLPKLTLKMEEHRPGGMDMPVEMDLGMEKQEAAFTTTGVRREALKFFGLADGSGFNGTFRGAFKGLKGRINPVVVTLRGSLKEIDMGDWKIRRQGRDQTQRRPHLLQARSRWAPGLRDRCAGHEARG